MAALLMAAAFGLAANGAWADRGFGHERREHERHEHHEHHEWHGGIYLGPTFFWPGYGSPFDDPFFAFPPAPTVVEPPPVYIERGQPPAATPDRLWYYCPAAGAYYPYVKQCPSGWKTVVPPLR